MYGRTPGGTAIILPMLVAIINFCFYLFFVKLPVIILINDHVNDRIVTGGESKAFLMATRTSPRRHIYVPSMFPVLLQTIVKQRLPTNLTVF